MPDISLSLADVKLIIEQDAHHHQKPIGLCHSINSSHPIALSITLGWKSLMAQNPVNKLYDLSSREISFVTFCCLGRHEQQNTNDLKRSNGGKEDDNSDGTEDCCGAVNGSDKGAKREGDANFPNFDSHFVMQIASTEIIR